MEGWVGGMSQNPVDRYIKGWGLGKYISPARGYGLPVSRFGPPLKSIGLRSKAEESGILLSSVFLRKF
jgi:hypothetical protein